MDVLNFRNVKQIVLPSGENVRRIADVNDNTLWLGYVKIEYYTVTNVTQKVKTEEILYGEDGTPPVVPERIGDYYANTWDPPCKNVMTDITAYNVYTLKYSATFKNRVTGAVLSSALYLPGQSVTYPGNPSKQYYTFTGWTPESVPDIQENTTIFAEFSHNEIVVDTIERSFSYDEQQHQFVATGHLNNSTGTPRVTYSLDQVNWTETPYQRSARNTKLLVYYRLEYENYEAYTSSAYLEIDEGEKFQVTFYYRDGDDNPQTYTDEVLYGLGATAPTVTGSNAWVFDGWDKDFSHVTSDLDVTAQYSRRVLSCYTFSSLSVSNVCLTSFWNEAVNPVPSCDHTPADRYVYQYMYTYGEDGLTTLVNNSEFANFTQDGLSVYPYYRRKYWLSVDVVQDTTAEFLRAYDVLSGNSVLSSQIELPTYEDWEFSHWEPEVWNPIERDTSISAVYEDTGLTLIADTGESISDDDGNYIDIVEVPKYGTVIYNTGYDAPGEGEYLVDDMGNYIVDSDGNYIKVER